MREVYKTYSFPARRPRFVVAAARIHPTGHFRFVVVVVVVQTLRPPHSTVD